jgi:NOL1/NOP2/sun family putative RNA methylase
MDGEPLTRYLPIVDHPEAFNQSLGMPLPACFWVNPWKTTQRALQAELAAMGIRSEPVAWYPGAWRARDWSKPGATIPHATGWYYLQEEIALAAVTALDPQLGDWVVDLCAAPGGKTAQIALRVGPQGLVIANDFNAQRLPQLTVNIARLGLTNVLTCQHDGATLPLAAHQFDRILVDAPCSGEGRMRQRTHETYWQPAISQKLVRIQQQLLQQALRLVKPGGTVVYSTCTLAPEENEAVLDAVLADQAHLEPVVIPGLQATAGLRVWRGQHFRQDMVHACRYFPHQNNTGGFFLARIRRSFTPASSSPDDAAIAAPSGSTPLEDPAPIEWLNHRYGLERGWQFPYTIWQKGHRKIWLTSTPIIPTGPTWQTLGITLVQRQRRGLKPSTAFLQKLGAACTRNIVELTQPEDAWKFLTGQEQSVVTCQPEKGFVSVRYGAYQLGCGLYRSGHLQSQFPKALQLPSKETDK